MVDAYAGLADLALQGVPALNLVLGRLSGSPPDFQTVIALIENLTCFYDVIGYHGVWLSEAAAREAHDHMFCGGTASCVRTGISSMLVKSVPMPSADPRFGWCYKDEDVRGPRRFS